MMMIKNHLQRNGANKWFQRRAEYFSCLGQAIASNSSLTRLGLEQQDVDDDDDVEDDDVDDDDIEIQ